MKKILIIKLGAKGDVIRTLPIAKVLKKMHANCEISWVTKNNVRDLLENSPYIDKLYTLPFQPQEEYDYLYNFDIEDEATQLAIKTKAKNKLGFYKEGEFLQAFNLGGEYYLNTLFDDETKKTNKKTYQEMMFETAELPYNKEHAEIFLKEEDLDYAEKFCLANNIKKDKLIGIHMGASPRWPSKIWHEENLKKFIKLAQKNYYQILIFGGPDEVERQKKFVKELESEGIKIFRNNPDNTDGQFAALVKSCEVMICSDSFALHIALALKKPTIGLFFCTPADEVEGYGLLKKIISPMFRDFFPEKMDQYSEELTKSISAEEVLSLLK